ncbi:hypothetical protein GCM10027578_30540 [Spirosoma luteolum]
MKKTLLLFFFALLGVSLRLSAQDAVYTANGSRLEKARITDVTDEKVSFSYQNQVKTFKRENILFAFENNKLLVLSDLPANTAEARQLLKAFQEQPARNDGFDYLIKAIPLTVIKGTIAYESEAIVNYKTADGKSASMAKNDLLAILYRTNTHKLLKEDYKELAPLLAEAYQRIAPQPVVALRSAPAPAATPVKMEQPAAEPTETPAAVPSPIAPATTTNIAPPVSTVTNVAPMPVVPANPSGSEAPVTSSRWTLSVDDQQYYRRKALDKVDEFVSYLNQIVNKNLPMSLRDRAIQNAVDLFMPGATMEVTSKSRPGSRRLPIATYLNNLKLLPYTTTKIEWADVSFLKELSQAQDGNYYGIITGEQHFTGYGANVHYEDVVQKNVRVKLKPIDYIRNGINQTKWNLLLGSIGVSAQ